MYPLISVYLLSNFFPRGSIELIITIPMELLNSLTKQRTILSTEKYWVTTNEGKLLDILCGNTAYIFGYSDPDIFESMISVQQKIGFLKDSSSETCKEHIDLVEKLCHVGNFTGVAWAVSGSDGVEAAVYTNDNYWKCRNLDKTLIVAFNPGYHGTTYLAKLLRKEYDITNRAIILTAPEWVDISDRETEEEKAFRQLEECLTNNPKVGAVLMESCPWIAGVKPWSETWWKKVRNLCNKFDVNFIVDDVLGGVGKLGYVFSHQRYNVQPDIVAIGKSLTGGYTPLSCACVTERISTLASNNWDFGHTWSPVMGGVGAALAVLKKFDSSVIAAIEQQLTTLGQELETLGLVHRHINQGLLMQVDLVKQYPADVLIKNGIYGNLKSQKSIFFCAPYIADEEYFIELRSRLLKALI